MKTIILALLSFLHIVLPAHAADPALEALETLRRGFAGTNDMTAEITQEKQLSLMKQKMVSKGVVRFRKPDTFYMELYPPHASKVLLKDNVMMMKVPGQETPSRVTLPPEEGLRKWFAYLGKPVTTLPEGVGVKGERHGKQWVMQLIPKSKGSVKQLTMTFDNDGKISRMVIDEQNKDRTILLFSRIRKNIGLKDADFRID